VAYIRQPRNVGHIANFQTCLERAQGEIVHLLHGDDAVRPGFYTAMEQGFNAVPNLGAAFCRSLYMDEDGTELGLVPEEQADAGVLPDAVVRLAVEQRVMTPSMVVRRSVYESLGGFDKRLACSEDWEMWVRIAAHYPIWYEPRPLALYRMHATSNTGRHLRTAEDMSYTRKAIAIFGNYLPSDRADRIVRQARRTYAISALSTAKRLRETGDLVGFRAQALEAFRLAPSLSVARAIFKTALGRRHADARQA
jgi:hypothetical protein